MGRSLSKKRDQHHLQYGHKIHFVANASTRVFGKVKEKLTSKFANMIQTAPNLTQQSIQLILHLRSILQGQVGVGKRVIALDAHVK